MLASLCLIELLVSSPTPAILTPHHMAHVCLGTLKGR